MKKIIFVALLSILIAPSIFAQVKVGIRGGISTTDIQPEQLLITNKQNVETFKLAVQEANYGIHLGLFAQARLGGFFIQPEVLFNSNSVDFQVTDLTDFNTLETIRRESYQYLDFPIMAGVKLGPLRLQGGPVGHLFVNSTSDLLDLQGYDQNFEKMSWGYQAGVGLDLWKIILDVKYEGGFKKFGDHIVFDDTNYNFDATNGRVVFSMGVTF